MRGHPEEISDTLTVTDTNTGTVTAINHTVRYPSLPVPMALVYTAGSIYLFQII